MKIAYCVNNNGEKIQISAYDANYKKYFGGLTCPSCGEQVDWIDGQIQGRHFRHHHSSYRQDCENYCTSISTNRYIQPYEREGLPLFLIKEFETYFLALGLFGLEETTIQEAEEIDLEIEIDLNSGSKINRKVNLQNFIPNKLELVKLSSANQQYHMNFNRRNLPSEIKGKWVSDINGIGINGALFYAGESGGKKVSSTVGIKINEDYLLFTRDKIDPKRLFSISFELLQELDFGWLNRYKIYKLCINEKNNETIAFCDRFDMKLSYSQPELIPLWPPCITLEQELIYTNDCTKYFVLNTDDLNAQDVFSHKLQNKLRSEKINNTKSIISSFIKGDDYISIANLLKPFIFSTVKRVLRDKQTFPEIKIEQSEEKLIIETKTKIFINWFKKELLIRSDILKSENNELSIKANEKIVLVYGTDTVWYLQEPKKIIDKHSIEKIDKELLQRMRMCNREIVKQPDCFKWQILKFKMYPASYRKLNMQMKNGRISNKLIQLLRKY